MPAPPCDASGQPGEAEDLIDASEVARIPGLAQRNSVSTYGSRCRDFPSDRLAPVGDRTRLSPRGEILAWRESFTARQVGGGQGTKPTTR